MIYLDVKDIYYTYVYKNSYCGSSQKDKKMNQI